MIDALRVCKSLQIIVVDDQKMMRTIISYQVKKIFEQLPHKVRIRVFNSAKVAFDYIEVNDTPFCIFTDVNLEGGMDDPFAKGNGGWLIRSVRECGIKCPIFCISADNLSWEKELIEAGANGYIEKPATSAKFEAAFASISGAANPADSTEVKVFKRFISKFKAPLLSQASSNSSSLSNPCTQQSSRDLRPIVTQAFALFNIILLFAFARGLEL